MRARRGKRLINRSWQVAFACLLFAGHAHAGDATRIQLVAAIPNLLYSVVDDAGDTIGEVDGIATDALAGPNPGDIIVGAQLHLSLMGTANAATWGHVDGAGDFVPGLPGSEVDGSYSKPFGGAVYERLYTPPLEFDTTGPNNALERSIELAVLVNQAPNCDVVISKPLDLVKPPLVLVHGINFGPTGWSGFATEFETNRGFRTYLVDHFDSYSSGAPTYGGNGDIHDSYEFVRGGLPGSDGVEEALGSFRTGDASGHSGKRIVVQKADIVASSYGGLLSRWYVEQALDYDDDVRKIVTLGTPHRGTTATNMNVQVLNDPAIAAADSQFFSPILSMQATLETIDAFGFVRWKDAEVPVDVVPALRVMTYKSDVLAVLNDTAPFNDDVAYGSIVGTDWQIDFLLIPLLNLFYDFEPTRGLLTAQKNYFPWMALLDGDVAESDAVVPIWSQTLPARSMNVPLDHLSYNDSASVQNTVSIWLQDSTLPRGNVHRPAFLAQVIPEKPSRDNAFFGSTLIGTESVGGGLVHDAIVQVEFSGPTLGMSGGLPELDSKGGIVIATMTGMARVAAAGTPQTETLTLVEDAILDTALDVLVESINPGSTPVGELFTFSIDAAVARDQDASILGPDGSLANFVGGEVWSVGYEISGHPDYDQSPWTNIDYPAFALPTIYVPSEFEPFVVGTSPGSAFTAEGGVHATSGGGGTQAVNSELWEDNFFFDTLLEDHTFSVPMPSNTFTGALMPYTEIDWFLFKNGSGFVEGASGNSSGETNATVYQFLNQTGGYSNPSSANVSVNVAP
jgi:pimeloyl-ACP methyl ester carboxylesterase